MKRLIAAIALSLFFNPIASKSDTLICEIKYDETDLIKKESVKNLIRQVTKQPLVECEQIGVEYNDQQEPIKSKPIYSCCYKLHEIKN